jgi:DNA-binding transcriptional LysR family regulator
VDEGGAPDLARATLIHLHSATEDWSAWADGAGVDGLDLTRGIMVDTIQLAVEAALGGLGVMMGRRPLIDRELADGSLVPACDHAVDAATAYWLVGTPSADTRPDIVAFKRWVIEEVARL